jgi:trimeric autotransporter adhesin
MIRLTQFKNTTILPVLIALMLGCFALAPQARALCQEGCLTNLNTVLGDDALISNIGAGNTAIGWEALFSNTTGGSNTANGGQALQFNTKGGGNTATGAGALGLNRTGSSNTGTGLQALLFNTIGDRNTADGVEALRQNSTGGNNTAVGFRAGHNLTTGSNNIDIGNKGHAGESNTIRIGTAATQTATFIAGISGVAVAGGVGVIIDNNGQLGTVVSSERFKDAIKPMDKASEAILALKPVTFRYKHELDPKGVPQFALVAEEVEKVNPDLVARDEQGKPYTVRYDAVNAMLLNEFLKEHRQVENQQRKIESLEKAMAEQQKENAAMRAMLSEQAAQIQKVSAQLELSKTAPQTVLNNR